MHWPLKVLGQALLAENQASAEGMRYLQVGPGLCKQLPWSDCFRDDDSRDEAALGIYKESDDFVGL